MKKINIVSWAAALGFAISPAVAMAADDAPAASSDTSIHDTCVANCEAQMNGATGTATPKKAHKHAMRTKITVDQTQSTDVNDQAGTAQVSGDQSASLDAARAEERARAAEEFRAEEQKLNTEHQAELERVRAEERDLAAKKTQADIANVRAENARLASARPRGPSVDKALLTPVGLYGYVGGGASDFTQPSAAGSTKVGGYWDARLGIGTRSIIGAEVAYVGGARDITALGLSNSAFLLNNGVEGVARLNVPITSPAMKTLVEPYTFGGVGWQHYQLANATTNTSSVSNNDDIMTVPVGVGLALGFSGITLDGRVTYRQALFNDLLGSPTSSFDRTSLNSWGAGAALGFEF